MKNRATAGLLSIITLVSMGITTAQASPALSSRPGAAYTMYLDFDGFTFNGQWGGSGTPPGTSNAYGNAALITDTWARVAEKYSSFDINVTTVDPAVAAGQSGSDTTRQTYYDNTARLMHTVISNNSSWSGGGGVSYVGVAPYSYSGSGYSNGYHTNWVFANNLADASKYIADATTHEDGHGLGLSHQSDYHIGGGTSVNEYSTNNYASGNGSYSPNMGAGYYSQRSTWRVGTLNDGSIQNDVQRLLTNSGMSLVDDSIGHTFLTATALPLIGSTVDATLAQGVINPISLLNPDPIGINNYTKDYFKFTVGSSGMVSLDLFNGGDWVTPGTVAAGATLRSKLNIYQAGNLINPYAVGTESTDTMSVSFSSYLNAGDYYAEITSAGGYQSTFDSSAKYYEMGSYVLKGSGIVTASNIPESGTVTLLGATLLPLVGILARRRKA